MSKIDVSSLVNQARDGNKSAFGELVERTAALVTGIAWSVCGDFALSEDIGQEAFLEAWKQLSTLREPGKFTAWVCTIARRRAIDAVRQSPERQRNRVAINASELIDPSAKTPEQMMTNEQERAWVWSLLESLPETYRETMVLFYRGEQSTREVAIALNESEATIRQRLKRGREMLRTEVTDSIGMTLLQTAPNAAFAAAVVASLPSLSFAAGATATTTTAMSAGSKSSAAAATAMTATGGALFGTLMGFAGGIFGTWMSWKNSEYESQQRFVVRMFVIGIGAFAVFALLLTSLIWIRVNGYIPHDGIYATLLIGVILGFQVFNGLWIWRCIAGYKRLGKEAKAKGVPMRESARLQQEKLRAATKTVGPDGTVQYQAFRWNVGGWWGSMLGSSCWMLPIAGIMFYQLNFVAGAIVVVCFLVAVLVAARLWIQRSNLDAYAAVQKCLGLVGLLSVVVFATVQFGASAETQAAIQWSPWAWLTLLIFPGLAFNFHHMHKNFDAMVRESMEE